MNARNLLFRPARRTPIRTRVRKGEREFTIALLLLLPLAGSLCAAPPSGDYVKVWEDTFDTGALDTNNWTIGLKDPGTGDIVPGAAGQYLLNTGYAGYITEEDVEVQSGSLRLKNQKRSYTGTDPVGSYDYTSGWVMSMHKVHFNKGYVEIRAKFPTGDKVWPALWLIAEDLVWGPEWDMWEYFGYRQDAGGYDVMGTHLLRDEYPNQKWSSSWIQDFDATYDNQQWHIYGFEWTDTHAKWYIDGVLVHTLNNTFGSSWPNEDMYLVLNNGVKSSSPDATTTWPNQLEIDYVSLYQIAAGPSVTLSVDNAIIAEAGGTATVTATASTTHTSSITVHLAFSGPATQGVDFSTTTSSIVIPAGSTTGTAVITATADTQNELNEMIVIDISSVINGTENGSQQVATSIIDDDGDDVIDTWIIAGQSNAEGYGLTETPIVSGLTPTDTLDDIGRSDLNAPEWHVQFYQGTNDYNSVTTSAGQTMAPKNSWHVMTPYEGLAFDWSWDQASQTIGNVSRRRFGPELAFASDVRQALGRQIAIIKYARGSVSLASNANADSGIYRDYDPSDSRLNHYDQLISTVQGAVDSLQPGLSLNIRGVIWMQGESDANAAMAPAYQTNLTELISTLRTDLSSMAASSGGKMKTAAFSWDQLDFFIGTILNNNAPHTQTVIDAQHAVAAADPHVFTVDGTNGISTMTHDDWAGDGIHYDSAGQVLLGERFAAKALVQEGASYNSWTTHTFALPFVNSDPTQNPDADAFNNLQEFAFGTDPTNPNFTATSYVEGGALTSAGGPIFDFNSSDEPLAIFTRRKDHVSAGLLYSVDFTAALSLWTPSVATPQILTSDFGDYEAVSVPYPASVPVHSGGADEQPYFFRVHVETR